MDTPGLSLRRVAGGGAATAFHLVYRFGRLSALSFSLMLPLLGAATVSSEIGPGRLAGLCAAGLAFHLFAYVLNDVVDLPLDRTEPLRADSPLVRGQVQPAQALAVALLQVPAALGLHGWLFGGRGAAAALLGGMGLMAAYDLYGKRVPFPPLSDAVQGLAWAGLAAYGALAAGGAATPRTGVLLALVFVYVLMINGVHGGLRDVANDRRGGARTTALFLGARDSASGTLSVPRRLVVYALTLQGLLLGISLFGLSRHAPAEPGRAAGGLPAAVLLAHGLLLVLLRMALAADSKVGFIRAGILHLLVSLACVFLPFAFFMDRPGATYLLLAYAIPVLVLCLYDGVTWES